MTLPFFLAYGLIAPSLLQAVPFHMDKLPKQDALILSSEKDIPAHIHVARQFLKTGKFHEAAAICERVINMKQDDVDAHACLAGAYKGLGKDERYEKEAKTVRELAPGSPALFLSLAAAYSALDDPNGSERAFKEGLKSSSDKTELLMGLGELYISQNRFKEAADQYLKVLDQKDLEPKYFLNASFALCRLDLQQGSYDQVIDRARRITELYPPLPQGYQFLGSAYLAKDKPSKAVAVYERLLKANSETPVPYQELAIIYLERMKDPTMALQYASEGARKFQDDPKSQDVLGWVHLQQGNHAEALKCFEHAANKEKTNPFYLYHMGLAHLEMGHKKEAKRTFEDALRIVDKNDPGNLGEELRKRIKQCE